MSYSEFSPYALARARLTASMRTLYEDTLMPVREIARLAGITETAVYALARRHRWRLREPLKARHHGPPPQERLKPKSPSKRVRTAADEGALQEFHRAVAAKRSVPTVAAQLQANAAALAARRKAEADRRTLVLASRTLYELARLTASLRRQR